MQHHADDNEPAATLKAATGADVEELWQQYRRDPDLFFVDISGPDSSLDSEGFRSLCTEDAKLWVWRRRGSIRGFMLMHQVDRIAGLATVQLGFQGAGPRPNSAIADAFHATMRQFMRSNAVDRLQMFALASENSKLRLAEAFGFVAEGRLREQFRHLGRNRDLAVLGLLTTGLADCDRDASALPPGRPPRRAGRGDVSARPLQPAGAGAVVTVRPLRRTDNATVRTWLADPGIQALLDDSPLSDAALNRKLQGLVELADDRVRGFLIEFRGKPAGLLHFLWINRVSNTAEVDLMVAPGNARNTLLLGALLQAFGRTAFETMQLHKAYGFVYGSNPRALRLMTRLMPIEARLRGYRRSDRGREPALLVGLLASDYRELVRSVSGTLPRPRPLG